jgi:interferon, gamma-inducible protein 30
MEEAEGNPSQAESCFQSSMADSGLAWDVVSTCYKDEYQTVQSAGMAATPAHDYVPWVVVDGRVLQYPDASLLSSICKAYTGPVPESCSSATVKRVQGKWTKCDV